MYSGLYSCDLYREDDELEGKSKVMIVDFQPMGDLTALELTYTKKTNWFFGVGNGADEWSLEYVIVKKEAKQ